MRLTRLTLHDWMGYADADLDLSAVSSIAVVGENGSGKSSLLDAITWALFDRSRLPGGGEGSSPVKHIRRDQPSTSVTVEWIAGEHQVRVTRSHERGGSSSLQLTVDDERISAHTTAETRERIAGYVGMDYAPLLAGPIMVQAGQYTTATGLMQAAPRERKEILMEAVADGGIYARLHDKAKAKATETDALHRTAETRIVELEEQIGHERDLAPEIARAEAAIAEAQAEADRRSEEHAESKAKLAEMEARGEQLAFLRGRVDTLTLQLTEDQAVLEKARQREKAARAYLQDTPASDPVDEAALERAKARTARANEARVAAAGARATRDAARVTLDHAERDHAEREGLLQRVPCHGEGIYATCPLLTAEPAANVVELREAWQAAAQLHEQHEHQAADYAAATEAEDELRAAALRAEKIAGNRERAETAIAEAGEDQKRYEERIERATIELNDVVIKRDAIAAAVAARTDLERTTTRLMFAAQAAREAVDRARHPLDQLRRQQAIIERARNELDEWRRRSAAASEQAGTFQILAAAFHRDGIPTLLIEMVVPVVEQHANEILGRLPGGLQIAMTTGAEGGSDRLNVTVASAGAELDYYMLSIGQRFRVDLALRIALARVLATKSGTTVETLWLDEPLAHVDARGRAAVVETLGAIEDEFSLIVVVSHHNEFNDAFPNLLQVSQDGDGISMAEVT